MIPAFRTCRRMYACTATECGPTGARCPSPTPVPTAEARTTRTASLATALSHYGWVAPTASKRRLSARRVEPRETCGSTWSIPAPREQTRRFPIHPRCRPPLLRTPTRSNHRSSPGPIGERTRACGSARVPVGPRMPARSRSPSCTTQSPATATRPPTCPRSSARSTPFTFRAKVGATSATTFSSTSSAAYSRVGTAASTRQS